MSNIPSHIFRAYDIRGIVDKDLNDASISLIAKAIGTFALGKNIKEISLGRDGRLSSENFARIISDNLLDMGISIIDVGMVTTPMLYFSSLTITKGSGIMITGSHNPPDYNGLKIMLGGDTLFSQKIEELYRIIKEDKFFTEALDSGSYKEVDIFPRYLGYLRNNISLNSKLKLVIDTANGVVGRYAGDFFRFLGCDVKELFSEVDGNFPNHNPDPSNPANLKFLIDELKDGDFDLGIAFDGDGDRLVVVDSEGKVIWPDRLLMLFVRDILSKRENTIKNVSIIYDIKSTGLLSNWIIKHGGTPIISKTGHSFIKDGIKNGNNVILAGELSGHIFFNDKWFGFDDGLYASARLLEILSKSNMPSKIFNSIPQRLSTPEINILVEESEKYNIIDSIKEKAKFPDAINIINIDGLRVEYNNGFGLIRASNTTACLVLRFEADSEDRMNKIKEDFKNSLKLVNIDFKL